MMDRKATWIVLVVLGTVALYLMVGLPSGPAPCTNAAATSRGERAKEPDAEEHRLRSLIRSQAITRYHNISVEALKQNLSGFYGTSATQAKSRLDTVFDALVTLHHKLRTPDVVMIDVGAGHCYEHCDIVPMLQAFPCNSGARFFAFEPLPGPYQDLLGEMQKQQPENHHCVSTFQAAVGDAAGEAIFVSDGAVLTMSGLKDVGEMNGREYAPESTEFAVQIVTLDDTLEAAGVKRVHFAKVDVEGAEWRVVQGTRRLLERGAVDAMVVEYQHFWNRDSNNYIATGTAAATVDAMTPPTLKTVTAWLHALGYDTFLMHETGVLQVNGELWQDEFELCRDGALEYNERVCWCDILITQRNNLRVEALLASLQTSFLPAAPRSWL